MVIEHSSRSQITEELCEAIFDLDHRWTMMSASSPIRSANHLLYLQEAVEKGHGEEGGVSRISDVRVRK